MENTIGTPPRWDMSVFYPSLDSAEFKADFQGLLSSIDALKETFDANNITAREPKDAPVDARTRTAYETVTQQYNSLLVKLRVIRGYINAFIDTDSRDELPQALMSVLQNKTVTLGLLGTRYTAFQGSLDVEGLIATSTVAADHAYYLREAKIVAKHILPTGEEELAAELDQSGSGAWDKLHGDMTSQLTVPFIRKDGGAVENLPMSVIRGLASDPDGAVRKRAYEAELASWETVTVPLAAAMNSIKHESNVFASRRGWGTPLDRAVFGNHIDRLTLDAMLTAAKAAFPDFRRYLRAKAKLVSGAERLPWYDLFAPIGDAAGDRYAWDNGTKLIVEQFGTYSPKLQAFAERAFRENWIDGEPRPGKRDGAYCMGMGADVSRILQNYRPSFNSMSTLAHELGHAYHNLCLSKRTPLQRGTPMTLAETASIFCETIIKRAALQGATEAEQLPILEASLQGNCQTVVDITSRFLFEQGVLEKRRARELSVRELNELMIQAQKDTYGDGLDENYLHPYMWAVKGHYYGSTFYNYPYMFGLLFGLGLYAHYQRDPEAFKDRYDDLLSDTGVADAATLALRFDIDLRDTAFWSSSLDVIREDIRNFERLAGAG